MTTPTPPSDLSVLTIHGISTPLAAPGVLRLVTLCRQSSDQQQSLEAQRRVLQDFVRSIWTGKVEIVAEFETTETGSTVIRADLEAIYEIMENGRADLILAEDTSRLSRHRRTLPMLLDTAIDTGVRLCTVHDGLDSADEQGAELRALLSGFSNADRNKKSSDHIRRSQEQAFLEGRHYPTPGWPLFDNTKVDSERIIDRLEYVPGSWELIHELFDRLEAGASLSEIADSFNDRGLGANAPGKRRVRFTRTILGRVVRDPALTGVLAFGRSRVVHHKRTGKAVLTRQDPERWLTKDLPRLKLIDPERQAAIVARLDAAPGAAARRGRRGLLRGRPPHWPSMHVVCGICGRPFRFLGTSATSAGKDVRYLQCSGRSNRLCWNSGGVDRKYLAASLHQHVMAFLEASTDLLSDLEGTIHRQWAGLQAAKRGRVAELRAEIDRATIDEKRLVDALINAEGATGAINRRLEEIEHRRAELERELAIAIHEASKNPPPIDAAGLLAKLREPVDLDVLNSQEYYRLMASLVPRIVVYPHANPWRKTLMSRVFARLDLRPANLRGEEPGSLHRLTRICEVEGMRPPKYLQIAGRIWAGEAIDPDAILAEIGCDAQTLMLAKRFVTQAREAGRAGLLVPIVPVIEGLPDPEVLPDGMPGGIEFQAATGWPMWDGTVPFGPHFECGATAIRGDEAPHGSQDAA
jgi:DNA invertase Pin-like site-specific DNA recombinase